MPIYSSPPTAGSPTPCCTRQRAADGSEQHADDCRAFAASAARRTRDLDELAGRPPGWSTLRPLDPTEVGDVVDVTGVAIGAGRRERRRWSVDVRLRRVGDTDALVRIFRRDGTPLGGVVDMVPAAAGAR